MKLKFKLIFNKSLENKLRTIDKKIKKCDSRSGKNLLETQKLLIKMESLLKEFK